VKPTPRSVLWLSSQSPFDPASGAARADRTICELLAEAGFRVRAIGTTASEHEQPTPHVEYLRGFDIHPTVERGAAPGECDILRFNHKGVQHAILDVGQTSPYGWFRNHHPRYMRLLHESLDREIPSVVYGYGGVPPEMQRRELCRQRGAVSLMMLHNWGYFSPGAFSGIDRLMACSDEVSRRYKQRCSVDAPSMPMPIDETELYSPASDPRFVTFINPSPDKGAAVMARVCDDICSRRADIPFLIVNARRTAQTLVDFGIYGGFDLRRHTQIVFSEGVPTAAPIFAVTRILMVPSVWDEPGGRVVAEAMHLGVPAIISDRGGMVGTARGGAIVLSIPKHIDPAWKYPITTREAAPWVEAIEMLWDDPAAYQDYRWRAAAAGTYYSRESMRRIYAAFFDGVSPKTSP
jgi:glycosyltransferase involved in cell wall biosynthesis